MFDNGFKIAVILLGIAALFVIAGEPSGRLDQFRNCALSYPTNICAQLLGD